MKAWKQSGEKSIKGAAVCRTSLTRCSTVKVELYWLWQELVWDGNRSKSRNPFKQVPRRDLICCFLSTAILFGFFVLIRLTKSVPAHLFIFTKKGEAFSRKISILAIVFSISMNIITVLVTATAVWHLIGNLKWNLLLPSEATLASFSLFLVVFRVFSLGLDVGNLPLRNPQQKNKWFR